VNFVRHGHWSKPIFIFEPVRGCLVYFELVSLFTDDDSFVTGIQLKKKLDSTWRQGLIPYCRLILKVKF
jgi:hypothetical protein